MTMFSFGTIKYNTAFFGSVSIVREKNIYPGASKLLADQMKEIQANYDELPLKDYQKKIKTTFLMKFILANKTLVKAAFYYMHFNCLDGEDFIVSRMRGFAPGDDFL